MLLIKIPMFFGDFFILKVCNYKKRKSWGKDYFYLNDSLKMTKLVDKYNVFRFTTSKYLDIIVFKYKKRKKKEVIWGGNYEYS